MSSDVKKLPEDAPRIPFIPASIHIRTEKPDAGWWKWNIEFKEEGYRDHEINPWVECGRPRRQFMTTMHCSDAFDPVPDLHWFLIGIKKDAPALSWEVDEEGRFFTWQVWNLDAVKVCLRIFSSLRDEDISWHFVLDRDAFIAELDAAYTSFGAQGGWGATWCDWAIEDGYREEVIIDTGTPV